MTDPTAEIERLTAALTATEEARCLAQQAAREAQCKADSLQADVQRLTAERDLLRAGNIELAGRIEICSQLLAKRAEKGG